MVPAKAVARAWMLVIPRCAEMAARSIEAAPSSSTRSSIGRARRVQLDRCPPGPRCRATLLSASLVIAAAGRWSIGRRLGERTLESITTSSRCRAAAPWPSFARPAGSGALRAAPSEAEMKLRISRMTVQRIDGSVDPRRPPPVPGPSSSARPRGRAPAVDRLDHPIVQVAAIRSRSSTTARRVLLVEPGVLDRDSRVEREHLDQHLVLSLNSVAPSLLVRYSRPIGAPPGSASPGRRHLRVVRREAVAGGWSSMSGIRDDWFSRMISPSSPWPRGRWPIRSRACLVRCRWR